MDLPSVLTIGDILRRIDGEEADVLGVAWNARVVALAIVTW